MFVLQMKTVRLKCHFLEWAVVVYQLYHRKVVVVFYQLEYTDSDKSAERRGTKMGKDLKGKTYEERLRPLAVLSPEQRS